MRLLPVLVLLLAGCTAPAALPGDGEPRALALERIEDCSSRQASELNKVVQTQREWEQLWRQACGDGSVVPVAAADAQGANTPPLVDFAQRTVLATFWGQKNNGGFGTQVEVVEERGGEALVRVARVRAGPSCATLQAITYPHDIVVVAKLTAPVRWTFQDRVQDC